MHPRHRRDYVWPLRTTEPRMNTTSLPAPLTLRGTRFDPPLFCAPMAGITHSAFRRLVAEFGGYGALFTEMRSRHA
jgi:hypothetical protein